MRKEVKQMGMLNLKPCPFCGSEVTFNYNGELVPYGIKCTKCGYLLTYMKAKKRRTFEDIVKQTAERWNRRKADGQN